MPDTKLWVNSSFHSALKNILTFKFSWSPHEKSAYGVSLQGLHCFFSGCFQGFLSLVFKSLIMMCIDMDSWDLSCLEFLNLYVDVFSSNLASFQSLFFKCLFILLSFSSAFLDSNDMNVGYFVISPQVPEAQSLFPNLFSIFHIGWILLFCPHVSLIHHLHSTVSPSSKS